VQFFIARAGGMFLRMPGAKGKHIELVEGAGDPVAALPGIAARRAKAAYPWRWQPGVSGNPGGISRFYYESRRIFREASPEAAKALVDLARHAEDERVRSICLVAVLDRSGVRPIDHDPAHDVTPPSWDPGVLSAEQREQLKEILRTMIAAKKPG
jgi:hypothetical protein